jgi:hypothetical protein
MEVSEFWQHIDALRGPRGVPPAARTYNTRLRPLLSTFDTNTLLEFDDCLRRQLFRAMTRPLWIAGMLLNGGRCGDDVFRNFRSWLVAHGQTVFDEAVRDPNSLADLGSRGQV